MSWEAQFHFDEGSQRWMEYDHSQEAWVYRRDNIRPRSTSHSTQERLTADLQTVSTSHQAGQWKAVAEATTSLVRSVKRMRPLHMSKSMLRTEIILLLVRPEQAAIRLPQQMSW